MTQYYLIPKIAKSGENQPSSTWVSGTKANRQLSIIMLTERVQYQGNFNLNF